MDKIRMGIVGAGWRAEFFTRIAAAAPDVFAPPAVVARNAEKAKRFAQQWDCAVYATIEEMLAGDPIDFAVTSLPWAANPELVKELVRRGVPVLSETPPAPDVDSMVELWQFVEEHKGKVCVAEQYFLQPYFAALRAVIASGKIGSVSQAQVSAAHGYHGMSLMRKLLGIGYGDATISARAFTAGLVDGPGRDGPPAREEIKDCKQTFFWIDFGGKLGLMDFCGEQYFSWVRNNRVLVRGERGEIVQNSVAFLQDHRTPLYLDFLRHTAGGPGNLEGNYLKGIQLGEEMVYENPLAPAALSDDEIAIGDLLLRMAAYVQGNGDAPYPLAEACQDHYLGIVCAQALESGREVQTQKQPWAP
ncbi:MAG: putative dehydrogenase [Candidatus Latescibacterota bacterium]|jgi:predicted dehydrogenase